MKKLILFITLIGLASFANAQKQGNIWYFEGHNGMDFNSGTPVQLTNGQIPITADIEGTATISDSSGNLLFYATAQNIWNKHNQLMPNGTGLMGGESTTQGVFILPLPASDNIFYVFTLDEMQNCFQNGLRYSIVDMCLDSALGDIEPQHKNILLLDSAGEKLACTFHANGTDIWLIVHKYFSDAFYAYLITASGITDTVISHVGSYHPADSTSDCDQAIGQMKISPDGSKIALVNENAFTHSIAELFDFNNNSGIVSNVTNLQPGLTYQYYGVSFSPDNSKLYITSSPSNYELFQYDLSSGIPSNIIASKTIIYTCNSPINGLQLGPDGKIYVVKCSTNYLDIITYPNDSGTACDYIANGFYLNHGAPPYSLPNFIDNYKYKNGIPNCKIVGINDIQLKNNTIYPNPSTNTLTIESLQSAIIKITNIQGRLIKTYTITDNKTSIDVSAFPSGVYVVEVKTEKGIEVRKFVKE